MTQLEIADKIAREASWCSGNGGTVYETGDKLTHLDWVYAARAALAKDPKDIMKAALGAAGQGRGISLQEHNASMEKINKLFEEEQ